MDHDDDTVYWSKSARFFANECYICKSRDNLKICECNMISYCSEEHRLEHLPIHQSFCIVIKELLKAKKLSHIYEILVPLSDLERNTIEIEIRWKIIKQLDRQMSPLEFTMWECPRICFVCQKTKQEELKNCPGCPVVSFCKKHKTDKVHNKNCKIMNTYINILNTADNLNIDLDFLPVNFPYVKKDNIVYNLDDLIWTRKIVEMETNSQKSRKLKVNLIHFIDVISKLNFSLQKIYAPIPTELTIHIDALAYDHAITKENYWEFLLHLNPQIEKLTIIIVKDEVNDNSMNYELCEKCQNSGKKLSVTCYSNLTPFHYNQITNVLFYFKMENIDEILNRWETLDCPIVFRFESKLNFEKAKLTHRELFPNCHQLHEGKLNTSFSMLSSIENKDYFLILKPHQIEMENGEEDEETEEVEEEENGEEEEENEEVNDEIKIEIFEHLSNNMFVREENSEHASKNNSELQKLQQQLNASIEEKRNLEQKLQQISNDLNKKNEVIGRITRDIANLSDKKDGTMTLVKRKRIS